MQKTLRDYLEVMQRTPLKSLERIVSECLHDELDTSGWGWMKGLLYTDNGVLEIASREVTSDSVSHSESGFLWDIRDHK